MFSAEEEWSYSLSKVAIHTFFTFMISDETVGVSEFCEIVVDLSIIGRRLHTQKLVQKGCDKAWIIIL